MTDHAVSATPEVIDSIHAGVTAIATRFLGTDGPRAARGVLQLPGYYPPATRVLYAEDLSLWIRREDQSSPVDHWEVYVDGRRVARVEVPGGVVVHRVQDDALRGVEVDVLGVPHVVRFRIQKDVS